MYVEERESDKTGKVPSLDKVPEGTTLTFGLHKSFSNVDVDLVMTSIARQMNVKMCAEKAMQ